MGRAEACLLPATQSPAGSTQAQQRVKPAAESQDHSFHGQV
jgi:hypothetical protein